MTSSFAKAFALSFTGVLLGLALIWWLVAHQLMRPPPRRLMTPAFEMDLAEGWRCDREGAEWVCSPGPPPTSTIAVIAMKYRNAADTLQAYADHLRTPQTLRAGDGTEQLSQVKHLELRTIAGREWVDALHLGSELKGYYTHYLATVTSHIGILVTFSAYEDDFERYDPQLQTMIGSLLVYQQPLPTDGSPGPATSQPAQ